MIIWLASYPRSGNTFFRLVLKQNYGISTESIYDENRTEGVGMLLKQPINDPNTLKASPSAPEIQVVKTHELPSDENSAIYLVRDGRDALVSFAHFTLEYDRKLPPEEHGAHFDSTLQRLIEMDTPFGGWSGNVEAWLGRSAPTALLRYEDLIDKPLEAINNALAALRIETPQQNSAEAMSFAELHKVEPAFFRKGKAGAWREEMPPKLHRLFWEKHGATMQKLDYERGQNWFERAKDRLGVPR